MLISCLNMEPFLSVLPCSESQENVENILINLWEKGINNIYLYTVYTWTLIAAALALWLKTTCYWLVRLKFPYDWWGLKSDHVKFISCWANLCFKLWFVHVWLLKLLSSNKQRRHMHTGSYYKSYDTYIITYTFWVCWWATSTPNIIVVIWSRVLSHTLLLR